MKCVAVGLQKGGVCKTTNTLHLGAAMAELGKRVLIWDVDENRGATKRLLVPDTIVGTFELLTDPDLTVEDVIIHGDDEFGEWLPKGCSLLPSSRRLTALGSELEAAGNWEPIRCLRAPLEEIRNLQVFDLVLIDTSPNLQLATKASYAAADAFLLSMVPRRDAYAVLGDVLTDLERIRQSGINPRLVNLGVLLSMFDPRQVLSRHYGTELRKALPDLCFRTHISASMAVPRAEAAAETLIQSEPDHPVSLQYLALADEILERLADDV